MRTWPTFANYGDAVGIDPHCAASLPASFASAIYNLFPIEAGVTMECFSATVIVFWLTLAKHKGAVSEDGLPIEG
jgi:hypothetical protein